MATIIWLTNAKQHLRSLFDYYTLNASHKVAASLVDTIFCHVERLEEFPTMGMIDRSLSTSDATYQFIIVKWGKRTYRIYYLYEKETCFILAIWDCSMNPKRRKAIVTYR